MELCVSEWSHRWKSVFPRGLRGHRDGRGRADRRAGQTRPQCNPVRQRGLADSCSSGVREPHLLARDAQAQGHPQRDERGCLPRAGRPLAVDKHLSALQRVELVQETARLPELEYIFKYERARDAGA